MGVIVCLVGVFILSLIVVTLTLFTDLDQDELRAFNDIKGLSHNYEKKLLIDKHIQKIIVSRIKSKKKRPDLDTVQDKYWRTVNKSKISEELKKCCSHNFSYNDFFDNIREIGHSKLDPILLQFESVLKIEETVYIFLIILI